MCSGRGPDALEWRQAWSFASSSHWFSLHSSTEIMVIISCLARVKILIQNSQVEKHLSCLAPWDTKPLCEHWCAKINSPGTRSHSLCWLAEWSSRCKAFECFSSSLQCSGSKGPRGWWRWTVDHISLSSCQPLLVLRQTSSGEHKNWTVCSSLQPRQILSLVWVCIIYISLYKAMVKFLFILEVLLLNWIKNKLMFGILQQRVGQKFCWVSALRSLFFWRNAASAQ